MTTPTPTDADDDGDFNDQSITVSWSRINWIQIQSPNQVSKSVVNCQKQIKAKSKFDYY